MQRDSWDAATLQRLVEYLGRGGRQRSSIPQHETKRDGDIVRAVLWRGNRVQAGIWHQGQAGWIEAAAIVNGETLT